MMNVPDEHVGQRGAATSMSLPKVRAKAMAVLARRHITEWEVFWVKVFSGLLGALWGWLIFPEHFAVGGIAAMGWAFAVLSLQQCAQLRQDVNALTTLAKIAGPSGS
jgi:hypothetical protein